MAGAGPWLIRLEPRSPFHLGAHSEDLDRARPLASSDTLFGALCWAYRAVWGAAELEAWLERFREGDPPLRISSMLPVLEHGPAPQVLLPLPYRRPVRQLEGDRKLLKHTRFIDREAWRGLFADDGVELEAVGEVLAGAAVAAALREPGGAGLQPWALSSRPRVTVDRISGASALFEAAAAHFPLARTGAIRLMPGIIVLASDPAALDRILTCFEVLGEAGIGGERSTGLGRFRPLDPVASPVPVSGSPGAGPLLSLAWPTPADLASGALELPADRGYRVVERGGWIASPEWQGRRSRRVAMVAEGSYLGGNGPGGGLADVTPEAGGPHPVYRYGFGLFLEEAAL